MATVTYNKTIGMLCTSLEAFKTCPGKSEICRQTCYCLKAMRQYKQVQPAHKLNTKLARINPFGYIEDVLKAIDSRRDNKRFRFNSFGDIFDSSFIRTTIKPIVQSRPKTKFVIFTKLWVLGEDVLAILRDLNSLPNMYVMLSYDDSMQIPPDDFQHAYVDLNGNTTCCKQTGESKTCNDCNKGCFNGLSTIIALH